MGMSEAERGEGHPSHRRVLRAKLGRAVIKKGGGKKELALCYSHNSTVRWVL